MTGKPLAQRLDDLARGSGLFRMTMIERPSPRNLRWLPLAVIVATVAGYVTIEFASPGRQNFVLLSIVGSLLLYGGFSVASVLRFFGPRLVADGTNPLDEREKLIRANAVGISGTIVTLVAIGGCFWMGFAKPFGLWMPRATYDWIGLAFLLEGVAFALPTLVASWLQGGEPADDYP